MIARLLAPLLRPGLSNEERFERAHRYARPVNWHVPGHSWRSWSGRCQCGWSQRDVLGWREARLNHDRHLAEVVALKRFGVRVDA